MATFFLSPRLLLFGPPTMVAAVVDFKIGSDRYNSNLRMSHHTPMCDNGKILASFFLQSNFFYSCTSNSKSLNDGNSRDWDMTLCSVESRSQFDFQEAVLPILCCGASLLALGNWHSACKQEFPSFWPNFELWFQHVAENLLWLSIASKWSLNVVNRQCPKPIRARAKQSISSSLLHWTLDTFALLTFTV